MKKVRIEEKRTYKGLPTSTEVELQQHHGKSPLAQDHIHSKIEMLYCIEGKYRAVLGETEYLFSKGDLLMINSWEVHRNYCETDQDAAQWVIKLEPEILYNSACSIFEAQYVRPFLFQDYQHPRLLRAEELAGSVVPECLNNLFQEAETQQYGFELAIRTNLCQIFTWILRHWNSTGEFHWIAAASGAENLLWLQQVFDYVAIHYREPIETAQVAELCNYSYSYFSHLFHQTVGTTFKDYLNSYRITQAEKLLCETTYNIQEIASMSGYGDTAYFIQKFRKCKGISPGKFRSIFQTETKQHLR